MAAFNFPDTLGQPTDGSFIYEPEGGPSYSWNGVTWQIIVSGSTDDAASIEIGGTPPDSPANGDMWWNSNDGKLYVYYVQTDGKEQWVEASPSGAFNGGVVENSITTPERTITTEFDLSTGPFWTAGAIDIPNPTNAVNGMGGLIRLTDAPTSWGVNFTFVNDVAPSAAGTVPFYVVSGTEISLGYLTPGV